MSETAWPPEVQFEERIVAFIDILGWKAKVEEAVAEPALVGIMAAVLNMFSVFEQQGLVPAQDDARISTFSDNVVVSIRHDPDHLSGFLVGLGRVQAGVAAMGFFLRGGVTIGKLSHTSHHVFGPGLNRAYKMESEEADTPRIILDPSVEALRGLDSALLASDGTYDFLDPFVPAFIDDHLAHPTDTSSALAAYADSLGVPIRDLSPVRVSGVVVLMGIMSILSHEMGRPLCERPWRKLAWLFDRIAVHVGSGVQSSDLPRSLLQG